MAKYLNTDGLTHLVELIKNGMAPKEHKHSYDDMVEDTAPVAKQITGETINSDLINRHGSIGEMTVFGNTKQNLWQNPSGTRNGITVTANSDGSISVSGTAEIETNIGSEKVYAIKPSTQYVLSVDKPVILVVNYYGQSGWISAISLTSGTSRTFTTIENFEYVLFAVNVQPSTTVSGTYRVMLNEGSEPEPWCPPGINGVEELSIVTAGKNLFKQRSNLTAKTVNGIKFTPNGDGSVKVSGTSTGIADFYLIGTTWNTLDTNHLCDLQEEMVLSGGSKDCRIVLYGVDDDRNHVPIGTAGATAKVIPGNSEGLNLSNLLCYLSIDANKTIDAVIYPQLELGSTATAYEPPAVTTTPVDLDGHALNSLPDGTRDELRIDGTGAVTVEKNTHTQTFDGSETWWQYESNKNYFTIASDALEKPQSNGVKEPFYCDVLPCRIASGGDVAVYNSSEIGVSFTGVRAAKYVYINVPGATDMQSAKDWLSAHPVTITYATSEPETIELGSVELPSVKSDKTNVWIDANLPTQLEATIIDLPILPIASGGTGADNIEEARDNLGVYSKAEVDSKLDNIEINEVLPISKGGTGKITAKAAQNALLSDMNEATTEIADDTTVVYAYATPADGQGAIYKRKALYFWNYIKGKADAVYAAKLHTHTTHSATNIAAKTDLNTLTNLGWYYCPANATVATLTNCPTKNAFALVVSQHAEANQLLIEYMTSGYKIYTRNKYNDTWGSWARLYTTIDKPTPADIGAAASSHTHTTLFVNALINQDLNDYKTANAFYYAGGGNTCANKPSGVDSFGMFVMRSAYGWYTQILYGSTGTMYTRHWTSTAWTSWAEMYSSANKPTLSELGAAAASHKHSAADITSGTIPVSRGGTGLTASPSMLVNLASTSADTVLEASPRPGVTGTLSVAHGGTGATTAADALSNLGITISTSEAPATGTPGTIHIQML